jgi:hypothetical protein
MSVFSLYQLFEAQSFKDLPSLLREIVGNDEDRRDEVTERFLDLNDKDRWVFLQDVMATCLEHQLNEERAFYHVFFQQGVRGNDIDDDWVSTIVDDCEENETIHCGTQTDPVAVTEQVQTVNVPTTEKPKKTHKTRYTTDCDSYKCKVCDLHLASDGSLHNHYESSRHRKCLIQNLERLRMKVQVEDKVFTDFRTGANAPEFTWECETQKEIDDLMRDIQAYLDDDKKYRTNPIKSVSLTRHPIVTSLDGKSKKTNSWTEVLL